ncbi:MAG: hypothetical protein R3E99_00350 [Burkholderiaceae bacterium]
MRPERDALEIRFPASKATASSCPKSALSARFNDESILTLKPRAVSAPPSPATWHHRQGADMSLQHPATCAPARCCSSSPSAWLYTKWRDPGEAPRLHLFGQLKRIVKEWLDAVDDAGNPEISGLQGRYLPRAVLMRLQLADMACNKINDAITRQFLGDRPIGRCSTLYNPTGSTAHVRFNTSKTGPLGHERAAAAQVPPEFGSFSTATGKPSSAAWPNRTPRCWAYVKNHNLRSGWKCLPLWLGPAPIPARLCGAGR